MILLLYDLITQTYMSNPPVTFVYDDNGNQISAHGAIWSGTPVAVSMSYDYENRVKVHHDVTSGEKTTYTYSADGLKRSERSGSNITTLVWDGSDYLQGRD
ncbi:hypothetical protein QM565_30435 [Geitlerinema splendidum]|nr:hypothetical protein [Geitlerinema splendidum]